MSLHHTSGTIGVSRFDDYLGKRTVLSVNGPRGGHWAVISLPDEVAVQVASALESGSSLYLDKAGHFPGLLVSCVGDLCQVLVKESGPNAAWWGFSLDEEQAEAAAEVLSGKQLESALGNAFA